MQGYKYQEKKAAEVEKCDCGHGDEEGEKCNCDHKHKEGDK